MKTNKFIVTLLVTGAALSSCKKKGGLFCHSSTGDIVVETRAVADFSKIEVAMAADVYLKESPDYAVEVHASQNLQDIIETKVAGNKLTIELQKKACLKGTNNINIYISAPHFRGLSVSGSGAIEATTQLNSPDFDVDISGSAKVKIDSLVADNFSANISGSGDLFIVSLNTLTTQEINISGTGDIDAFGMPTLNADINISGSGNCDVHVIDRLKARISGSGKVRYMGAPVVDSDVSGSGTIQKF